MPDWTEIEKKAGAPGTKKPAKTTPLHKEVIKVKQERYDDEQRASREDQTKICPILSLFRTKATLQTCIGACCAIYNNSLRCCGLKAPVKPL